MHRRLKWLWVGFGVVGLVDLQVRGPGILETLRAPLADSIVVLFVLSVAALAIGEWVAEEGQNEERKQDEERKRAR